jgi:hypothetical protein
MIQPTAIYGRTNPIVLGTQQSELSNPEKSIPCAPHTIAFAAGIVGFWTTSLPAGSAFKSGSVDPHSLTLKAKDLPAQQIDQLY